ncbi:MAG: hypothetical protein V7L26_04200 [Nostoc sp.]
MVMGSGYKQNTIAVYHIGSHCQEGRLRLNTYGISGMVSYQSIIAFDVAML